MYVFRTFNTRQYKVFFLAGVIAITCVNNEKADFINRLVERLENQEGISAHLGHSGAHLEVSQGISVTRLLNLIQKALAEQRCSVVVYDNSESKNIPQ